MIDCGFHTGFAALGGGKVIASGSRDIRGNSQSLGVAGRHFDSVVRELILAHGPIDVIAFATPFVGHIHLPPLVINGKKVWRPAVPIQPNSIRPLMGFTMVIEMIAAELHISRCVEWQESRAHFLTKVQRKSKDIKAAVMQACLDRGWPCKDNHAGDALCIGAYTLERLGEPLRAHETTPLFATAKGKKHDRVVRRRKA